MVLTSIAERDGKKERTEVTFGWEDFVVGKDLGRIPVKYLTTAGPPGAQTGVTLTISDLRETWTLNDVKEVERDLLGLVSPFRAPADFAQSSKDPGFGITLLAPEFPEYEGKLEERFLSVAWGVLTGVIGRNGRAKFRLKIRKGETRRFSSPHHFDQLGRAYFEIHFFIYRADLFKGMPFGVAEARNLAREQAGVRIYMDRFRVFPYGDPGDDWLDLDLQRGRRLTGIDEALADKASGLARPMLMLPGTNQLYGAVFVSRRHTEKIELNISRERLIENEAFIQLKRFVRLGIDWMTVEYARSKAEEDRRARKKSVDPLHKLHVVRDEIESNEKLESESKARILQVLDLAEADWKSYEEEQISELSMIRVLASVGTMVVVFDHELRASIDALRGIYADLEELIPIVQTQGRAKFSGVMERLSEWVKSIEQQGTQVGLLLSREARQKKRRFAIRDEVARMATPFARYMSELGVEFKNEVPADLRTLPMFECELQSILVNLQTNALKAVKAVQKCSIGVIGVRSADILKITFVDTGVGIPPAHRDEIFKPFFTTSEPDAVLGVGTGLGLKIVKDLLEVYGGSIRVAEAPKGWNTALEIELPSRI
jgi:signal transduction histidine kinase